MNKEIEGYISQLDDEDPELRKVAISNLTQKDFKVLQEDDLRQIRAKVRPLMEDSNLTIRYFAKKTLKSCDTLLTPVETSVSEDKRTADEESMLWSSDAAKADSTTVKPVPRRVQPGEKEKAAAVNAEITGDEKESIAGTVATAKTVKPTAAETVKPTAAAETVKPAGDKQKPPKKADSRKIPQEVQYASIFARFVAVINLLIFIGFNYEALHYKVVGNSFPKVIAGDLMGQVVFGSLICFGLTALLLRSRISLLGISKLAAALTIAELGFAAAYPSLIPGAAFHGPEIFGFGIEFLTPTVPIVCFVTIAAFCWEDSGRFKPLKALYTLFGLYVCITPAFFALTTTAMPVDPMTVDGANLPGIAIIPAYLRPLYLGINLYLPLILPVVAVKMLYSLFTGKAGRFVYLILVLFIAAAPIAVGFVLFPNSGTPIFSIRNATARFWVKLHDLTGSSFLNPPEWAVEAARVPLPWHSETPAVPSPDRQLPAGEGKMVTENQAELVGGVEANVAITPKTAETGKSDNSAVLAEPTVKIKSLGDVRPFMLERIDSYLKARNNMLSRDDYISFRETVMKDFKKRMAGLEKPGSKEEKSFESAAEAVLKERLGVFFDDRSQANASTETGRPSCRVNLQILNGAVESYNFNQPSEALYMKSLDYNMLYPRHLTDGIPKCQSGGVYSLDSDSCRARCSIHEKGD